MRRIKLCHCVNKVNSNSNAFIYNAQRQAYGGLTNKHQSVYMCLSLHLHWLLLSLRVNQKGRGGGYKCKPVDRGQRGKT